MYACVPLSDPTDAGFTMHHCRLSCMSCLLALPNGALMTGGPDRCVRYWEPSWPERSYIVAGPVWPDDTGIMDHTTHKLQVRVEDGEQGASPN